jgi:hypothetical protein
MKKVIIFCVLSLFVGALTVQATPYTYTSTVTADNHYAIYTGNSNFINYIGTNESGSSGAPGTYNWSNPENFTFDVNPGDYIYVAGWSDNSTAQGWIGQFVSGTGTILSNATDWQVFLTFNDINDGGMAPTVNQFQNDIAGASWSTITNTMDNGASPWGTIGAINPNADWIWGSAMEPGSGYGEYQVFRTQVAPAPVPEPATMTLLGIGLLGAGLASRKKSRKSGSTD